MKSISEKTPAGSCCSGPAGGKGRSLVPCHIPLSFPPSLPISAFSSLPPSHAVLQIHLDLLLLSTGIRTKLLTSVRISGLKRMIDPCSTKQVTRAKSIHSATSRGSRCLTRREVIYMICTAMPSSSVEVLPDRKAGSRSGK